MHSKPKHGRWQLQEAKARFSEVVDTASREGPQPVTRRGRICAYVVSPEYVERARRSLKPMKFSELFAPLAGIEIQHSKELPPPPLNFDE